MHGCLLLMEQGVNLAVHHGTAAVLTSHERLSQSRNSGSGSSHQSKPGEKWLRETPESSFVSVPVIGIVVAISALALLVRMCVCVCGDGIASTLLIGGVAMSH